jgi:hypothetical protein
VGIALFGAGAWLRLGRTEGSRFWVGSEQTERTILVTLPLVGVMAVAGSMIAVGDASPTLNTLGGGLFAVALVVFILWGPLQLPLPRWTLPGWYLTRTAYRALARKKRSEEKRAARRGHRTGAGE